MTFRLAANRHECKTSTQFFQDEIPVKYRDEIPINKKLIFENSRKTKELTHELHHIYVMTITYPQKSSLIYLLRAVLRDESILIN